MIMDISDSYTEVIKIEQWNKNNTQQFKMKYYKKQKCLTRQLEKEKGNKNETIELIIEFIEKVIDNSAKIVTKLDKDLDVRHISKELYKLRFISNILLSKY